MTRDEFIELLVEIWDVKTMPGHDYDKAEIAADCIERAVRAERRGWCGDERGGFEQSAYTLPTPWSAAAGKDDET